MMVLNGLEVSTKDLNQRYANTYIVAKVLGQTPKVVYVANFDERSVMCNNANYALNGIDFQIIQEFPEMGAVNYRGTVHHCLRKPLRQWSRGLSSKVLDDFYSREDNYGAFTGTLPIEAADAMFNRKWLTWDEGIKQIKAGQINAFAMNPTYWIKGTTKNIYFWRDRIPIGEVMGKKIIFFPDCKLLQQEINDFLRGMNDNDKGVDRVKTESSKPSSPTDPQVARPELDYDF